MKQLLRLQLNALGETARLPKHRGVAAVGSGQESGLARSVGISVAFGEGSSLALALLLDLSGSGRTQAGRCQRLPVGGGIPRSLQILRAS